MCVITTSERSSSCLLPQIRTRPRARKERLIADIQQLLTDAQGILTDASEHADDHVSRLRAKLSDNVDKVKDSLHWPKTHPQKAREAADATDEYVHDNPWQSVGVAAAVGFLLGLLVSRR